MNIHDFIMAKVYEDHLGMLIMSAASVSQHNATDAEDMALVRKLDGMLVAIFKRHFSDGTPSKHDKQKATIEVLETCLRICKGEMAL